MQPDNKNKRIPSAYVTSGAGFSFEEQVATFYLAHLLLQMSVDPDEDYYVENIHFQTKRKQYNTDDLLIECVDSDDRERKLVIEVKTGFKIMKSDVCRKTFYNFWLDFKTNTINTTNIWLILAIQRGTEDLLMHFNNLLEQARASDNEDDFQSRIDNRVGMNETGVGYAKTIREILISENIERKEAIPTNKEYWEFLTLLHIKSFDFNTSISSNEGLIKNILAQTTIEEEPQLIANNSWHELLKLGRKCMRTTKSISYEKLPANLLKLHKLNHTSPPQLINALLEHGTEILTNTRSEIGKKTIMRNDLMQKTTEAINTKNLIVITAPPGAGKSVIAKHCIEKIKETKQCFIFKAEEFAVSHIDEVLSNAHIHKNGKNLIRLLSKNKKKIIFLDGIEKFIDTEFSNGFIYLLKLAKNNQNLTLLFTCRDNSLEKIFTKYLKDLGLVPYLIRIPQFDENEIKEVIMAEPNLKGILENHHLRDLLSLPYYMDMAAQIKWTETKNFPNNRKEFRIIIWNEVIRKNQITIPKGQAQYREDVFLDVAIQRARTLMPYIEPTKQNWGVLFSLEEDGLVIKSPKYPNMYALKHDVLDDWAILVWLDRRWYRKRESVKSFAKAIVKYPAIRRAYRKWILENLQTDPKKTYGIAQSIFQSESLPDAFKEDTIISVLKSPSASMFLKENENEFLKKNAQLLVKLIHFLRVACKEINSQSNDLNYPTNSILIGSEDAWAGVLEIISTHIDKLVIKHTQILTELIEDFAEMITSQNYKPKDIIDASKIGFAILEKLDERKQRAGRIQILNILAKMPANDAAFKKLFTTALNEDGAFNYSDDIASVFLGDFSCKGVCDFFPTQIIKLAKLKFTYDNNICINKITNSDCVERYFGFKRKFAFFYLPSSSLRSIFLNLLNMHPKKGFLLIINLLNHAGSWYGQQRIPDPYNDKPYRVYIENPGDKPIAQWANYRLWALYRGFTNGPSVLQCALMALEFWLIKKCNNGDKDLDYWLLRAIKDCNNVMATAVVASIYTLFPDKVTRSGVAILSSPELFSLDMLRADKEQSFNARGEHYFDNLNDQRFKSERNLANALPHRKFHLENLAFKLQFNNSPVQSEVFSLIDRYLDKLPPENKQNEKDKLWCIALHRIDLRRMKKIGTVLPCSNKEDVLTPKHSQNELVIIAPANIEPHIQKIVDQAKPIDRQQKEYLRLYKWSLSLWQNSNDNDFDKKDWRIFLNQAQSRDNILIPTKILQERLSIIAAVCARDFWDDMSVKEQNWCINKLVNDLKIKSDRIKSSGWGENSPLDADRIAACALPAIANRNIQKSQATLVRQGIALALTYPSTEVAMIVAKAIGFCSFSKLPNFTNCCIEIIMTESLQTSNRIIVERAKPLFEDEQDYVIAHKGRVCARKSIVQISHKPDKMISFSCKFKSNLNSIKIYEWHEKRTALIIGHIFSHQTHSENSYLFFRKIATELSTEFISNPETDNQSNGPDEMSTHAFLNCLSGFVLKIDSKKALFICEPLSKLIAKQPHDVALFLRYLFRQLRLCVAPVSFWSIWQLFSDKITEASWIKKIDSRHDYENLIVKSIFLNFNYKPASSNSSMLFDESHRVDKLALKLKTSSVVFNAYCNYLNCVGEKSLPENFIILAKLLKSQIDIIATLSYGNTQAILEKLLGRFVHTDPSELKEKKEIQKSVNFLLDKLVKAGSVSSNEMRDYFLSSQGK